MNKLYIPLYIFLIVLLSSFASATVVCLNRSSNDEPKDGYITDSSCDNSGESVDTNQLYAGDSGTNACYKSYVSFNITILVGKTINLANFSAYFFAGGCNANYVKYACGLGDLVVDHIDYGATFEAGDWIPATTYASDIGTEGYLVKSQVGEQGFNVGYVDGTNHYILTGLGSYVQDDLDAARDYTQFVLRHETLTDSDNSDDQSLFHEAGDGSGFYPLLCVTYGEVAVSTTSTPIIIAPSPADNANNNTNVTLWVNHSTVNNDVRYYLYFGDTSTLTEEHYYLFNATRTGPENKSFLTNVSDGIYYYKWYVENISSGIKSANTTQRTWTLDTVIPTINFYNNNNFSTDNSTIISSYLSNLSINISFFDINLYQTLLNITNSTGETVYSILNTSITGTTINHSRIVDISSWAVGNYTIKLLATDSHTGEEISPYDVNTRLNYFRYTTEEGNIIKIKSDTLPLTKSTTKLKDRYDFGFNYLFQKDTYKFIIESYNKIDYIEDSEYNAHFVIMGSNGRGNWIDFENPNLSKKDYKVTKIDDYTYEVEITANGLKSFTFNSLGGLNLVEEHYLLKIGAVLDVWVYDGENYPVQINATATIGTQSANFTTDVRGARLVNITEDITSLTLTSSGFGTEEKTISVTQSYHNFSFNMTPVSAAKFYLYDESSNTLIFGETFEVYLETTGFSQIYSGINSSSDNPYTITGLSDGLYKLKASSANYLERQYLDLNISNVTTTNLDIYLLNSTDGDEKTFNIVDEGLNPLNDVRVVFTKILNGIDTVIAEEDSDFAGQVILILNENTQYTISFTKTNYEDQTITLEPKNSEYVIKMISTIGAYNQSVHEGIRYRFSPSNTVLNNNTKYNFTFTLNSSVWDVTNCTLKLFNGTTNLLNNISSFTSNSCYVRIEQDTFSMANITVEGIYELNSEFEFTVTQQYRVIYTYEGEFSLKNFMDDLSDFAMAGFDSFGRMMLALIVIFIITALAARQVGFTNPEVLIFLVVAQVWLFSYVNWLYLDFAPIPTIIGFDLKKYIIAILITLAGGAFVMKKFTD